MELHFWDGYLIDNTLWHDKIYIYNICGGGKVRENQNYIAVYSRKSKFTGKGESIGNQVELCKEYIRTHYSEEYLDRIIVFEDEGFSGGNVDRPDFKKLVGAARERKFKALVVYRLDRISRNVSDFSNLLEELAKLDIDFVSIRERFDTGTPMGRAMLYIASVFAQLERETIAERIRDNMHELAKTGRWLGGATPTGYTSESVKSVTVDGRTKKACKLKLIPEEGELVRKIFELFHETHSLTMTEAELLRQRIKTKTGKNFTRFSIKGILQNPVYLIADEDAYDYFVERQAELFSELSEFDGVHGILAYNRTDQEKGRAAIYLPINKWIVSVGQHPGVIPAKMWIGAQELLEQNRSKSFCRPRSNEALLTGLLYCGCGERMYPKLSKRLTAEGRPVYTYVCKMKERSRKSLCDRRNASGNMLDGMIVDQIKALAGNGPNVAAQLEQSKKFCTGNRGQYEAKLAELRAGRDENGKKIAALVDSLVELGDSAAKGHVAKRIEELHDQNEQIRIRISELEDLTAQHALSDMEFDALRHLLEVFAEDIDEMTFAQKRAAVRAIVRRVVWDGQFAHAVLFGAVDDEIEYPNMGHHMSLQEDDDQDMDAVGAFADVDDVDELDDLEKMGTTMSKTRL